MADPNRNREILGLAQKGLEAKRAKTGPIVGVVSNFDPDIREFLTAPYQGFTSLQVGAGDSGIYGTLAVQSDYTKAMSQSEAEALGLSEADRERINKKRLVPRPGYPALIFPASGSSGPALNTSFIRGGKRDDLVRAYPVKHLTKAFTTYEFGDTSNPGLHITYQIDDTVITWDGAAGAPDHWDQNSPLPPGVRYWELQDLLGQMQQGIGALPIAPGSPAPVGVDVPGFLSITLHVPLGDIEILLPHDSLGNLRTNVKPLPGEAWWHLAEVYMDDTLWTGEVLDPLEWVEHDSYWQSRGITADTLAAFLDAHPGARLG
jgi:hypothetical protein